MKVKLNKPPFYNHWKQEFEVITSWQLSNDRKINDSLELYNTDIADSIVLVPLR